jgi:para-aminobenzoate synthetase component I
MIYPASYIFELMNMFGGKGASFLFAIDFEKRYGFFCELDKAENFGIRYSFGCKNLDNGPSKMGATNLLKKELVSFQDYRCAFQKVQGHILAGRSYLVNLTFATEIELGLSIEAAFERSREKYTVWFKDQFLLFSPETFVKIKGNKIFSYPMKGTIDATVENAAGKILMDLKEQAEHATITDLIRNDLSMVSHNVMVEKYRFIDKIKTNGKPLLQVSSTISGELGEGWRSEVGTIFDRLLPAGSVTGAPKKSTLDIIREAEISQRGFYTGVLGIFDGKELDSCVMIRFIEEKDGKLFFHSGGGITSMSDPLSEYQEMIDKIYVPFD